MDKSIISIAKMINYIWEKRRFLIYWIIIISSIFILVIIIQPKSEYRAKIVYNFPKSEIATDDMSRVLDFLQKGKTFNTNILWLQKTLPKTFHNEKFSIKKNTTKQDVSISLTRENTNNIEKDLIKFADRIDSLFIKDKLTILVAKRKDINLQMKQLDADEISFEKKVIENRLNEILEKLIIEEYSLKNQSKELDMTIENKTISKTLLISFSVLFSIWSGLMIVIISYFIKQR